MDVLKEIVECHKNGEVLKTKLEKGSLKEFIYKKALQICKERYEILAADVELEKK